MARPQRDMNASHRYAAGAETYSPSSLSTSTRQAPLLFNSPLTTRNSNIIKTELLNARSRPLAKPLSTRSSLNAPAPAPRPSQLRTSLLANVSNNSRLARPGLAKLPALGASPRPQLVSNNLRSSRSMAAPSNASLRPGALLLAGNDFEEMELEMADGRGAEHAQANDNDNPEWGDDDDDEEDLLGEWIDREPLITFDDDEAEDTTKQDDIENKAALVNSLAEPYSKHLATLKQEVLETMEPTLKHVHLVMSHIANEIEHTQYIQGGLMMYHQAGEEWDGTVNSEVGMLNAQIEESQARFKKIFAQLVEASESRAAWWTGVEALLDQTASAGDQAAADGQALLEKTIALAEKKIKTMTLGGGIGKKSKASSEMEKLKALMMNL